MFARNRALCSFVLWIDGMIRFWGFCQSMFPPSLAFCGGASGIRFFQARSLLVRSLPPSPPSSFPFHFLPCPFCLFYFFSVPSAPLNMCRYVLPVSRGGVVVLHYLGPKAVRSGQGGSIYLPFPALVSFVLEVRCFRRRVQWFSVWEFGKA